MRLINLQKNQNGVGHVVLVVIIVAVIAVIGAVAFLVMGKNKITETISKQAATVECNKEIDDKDLCKFLTNWEQSKKYKITSTSTGGGDSATSVFIIDGDKSHLSMTGEYAYEVITIGDTTYTKAGDTWYKQTKKPDTAISTDDFEYDFEEPEEESEDSTTYKSLGKEACGSLTCFKYQIVDPSNSDTKEFIWFDDKDYKLRRTLSEAKDGSVTESTFEYDNVSVREPSPVKELGENQYVVPGSGEVMTLPSEL